MFNLCVDHDDQKTAKREKEAGQYFTKEETGKTCKLRITAVN